MAALTPEPRSEARGITLRIGAGGTRIRLDSLDVSAARTEAQRLRGSARGSERWVGDAVLRQLDHQTRLARWRPFAAPTLMFVLVPAFAALTAVVLPGRARYRAHVEFALGIHAFAYVALILHEIAKVIHRSWAAPLGLSLSVALTAAYLSLALRRTYGLDAAGAVARTAAIGIVYGAALWSAVALATALRAELR